jgi:putative membrane protein
VLPEFHLHGDVLALVAVLAFGYWYLEARIRPAVAVAEAATTRQRIAWYSGVFVLLVASGYPMHDLAEETLFSAHMLEHMLIGYVVPPLLLVGLPAWMARFTIGRERLAGIIRPLVHPAAGFFAFNLTLVAIHWPEAVNWQNRTEWAHFAIHLFFFTTAVAMWMPVFSPTPVLSRLSNPGRMLYLIANTIIPIVPASFITFSDIQLYPSYGDAMSTWGLTALEDQTIAGIIMKLGGTFYLLAIIATIWFRWISDERRWEGVEREMASR